MANERIPPEDESPLRHATPKVDKGGEDSRDERPSAEAKVVSAEAARNEAEQLRRLAEETREVRDEHREAAEVLRHEREQLRELPRRREPPAKTRGSRPRAHVMPWWIPCARPPRV